MLDKPSLGEKPVIRVAIKEYRAAWVTSIISHGFCEHQSFVTERDAKAYAANRARLLLN
ncbi:hypothetical protein QO002_002938 [Pararhizobium capsulatum DSM 1112]|uniref:Uncharacterized protein n=1 Tax=Pararhizobium capsulatum DSM 1112 TaxID=1121113 RepID=A0ABU0BRE0_9HYPH|nr:hypothetical protein [Pararhizobium capsulatum]MDQ0320800.1 hypothetical protein [Pararhizobium capsulatum DSM 1112]